MQEIKRKAQSGELPLAFCAGAVLVCEAAEREGVVLSEEEVVEVVHIYQLLTVAQATKAVKHWKMSGAPEALQRLVTSAS